MSRYARLYYMNILGQLAFYSRIYRLWIEQPSTTQSNFIHAFPKINFANDLYEVCIQGFKVSSSFRSPNEVINNDASWMMFYLLFTYNAVLK